MLVSRFWLQFFFFFNDTATTEIYTLSLHDALPISYQAIERIERLCRQPGQRIGYGHPVAITVVGVDRKSTRLNSSHSQISYAVFCLKKKKKAVGVSGACPILLPCPLLSHNDQSRRG